MADKFDSVQFTSVTIALTRCWQQVHTDSGQHMRFAGQFFYVPADFVIKKADALGSYPVEFNLVRGTPEQHHVEHGIGKFAYHDIAGGLIMRGTVCPILPSPSFGSSLELLVVMTFMWASA